MAVDLGVAAQGPRARRGADTHQGLLQDRRILVTGVMTEASLAYSASRRLQELGAELVLTGFGRGRRLTERAAQMLPRPPDVLELDVRERGDIHAVAAELGRRWGRVDGVLHSVAYAPPDLWEDPLTEVSHDSLDTAMLTTTYSLQELTVALLDQLEASPYGGSVVALTFASGRASQTYQWMTVVKSALEGLVRQLAFGLGPRGVRANLISSGPVRTNAARAMPLLSEMENAYRERAPLGWDNHDHSAIAGPAAFLLSDLSRGVTGATLHVDGGMHVTV